MAQAPDEIMNEIDAQRSKLAQDVDELQDRLKEKVDWRVHYNRHPEWFLTGAAFVGLLLSTIFVPRKRY